MYYGKKKVITIAIVVGIIVIGLIIGGLYVFLGTDLLKPTNVTFWKYASKEYEKIELFTNNQYKEVAAAQLQIPYETKAKVSINVEPKNTNVTQNNLFNIGIDIDKKEDFKNDKQFLNLKAAYNNSELLDISYAKSNNIIALKCEEIVNKYFVGIKNENLKEFAKKLGITNTENIPDEIKMIDKSDLIELTKEEKEYIVKTYLEVINNSIPSSNYTKANSSILKNETVYNVTAYRLDLSEKELKNIVINILETLKQDSITLNLISTKAKILNLDEDYTNINNIVKNIDELEQELQKIEADESKGLSIIIYEDKNQVIQMELLFKNEFKITIQNYEENNVQKLDITCDNLSENSTYNTIKANIEKQTIGNTNNIKAIVNIDNDQEIEINIVNSGSVAEGIYNKVDLKTEVTEEISMNVSYTENIIFGEFKEDIIELAANKNCIVLNNYNDTQLRNILGQIVEQTSTVIEEKIQKIGRIYSQALLNSAKAASTVQRQLEENERKTITDAENQIDELYNQYTNNDSSSNLNKELVDSANSFFTAYEGNINGTALKSLMSVVSYKNSSSEKKVTLTIDGKSYDLVNKDNIKSTSNYNVKMEYDTEGYINNIIATSKN